MRLIEAIFAQATQTTHSRRNVPVNKLPPYAGAEHSKISSHGNDLYSPRHCEIRVLSASHAHNLCAWLLIILSPIYRQSVSGRGFPCRLYALSPDCSIFSSHDLSSSPRTAQAVSTTVSTNTVSIVFVIVAVSAGGDLVLGGACTGVRFSAVTAVAALRVVVQLSWNETASSVVSLCGRTYQTETAMWGRHVLFSNDHPCSTSNISITWVTSLACSI